MKFLDHLRSRHSILYTFGFWVIYAFISLAAPHSSNTYALSAIQIFLLQLTILVPVFFIWLLAVYGLIKFREYAVSIRQSPDGRALSKLTDGLALITLGFIIQSVLGVLPRFASGTKSVLPIVFAYNHIPMIIWLVGVTLIYRGSNSLVALVGVRITRDQMLQVFVPFGVIAATFAWLFYTRVNQVYLNGIPNFALPGHWPFFTLGLPYLLVWTLGLRSIINLTNYTHHVEGAIYKRALRNLAHGLMAVVTFATLLQLFSLAYTVLSRIGLGSLLAVIYVLLILYSYGFILIAMGARKLALIEEVR